MASPLCVGSEGRHGVARTLEFGSEARCRAHAIDAFTCGVACVGTRQLSKRGTIRMACGEGDRTHVRHGCPHDMMRIIHPVGHTLQFDARANGRHSSVAPSPIDPTNEETSNAL